MLADTPFIVLLCRFQVGRTVDTPQASVLNDTSSPFIRKRNNIVNLCNVHIVDHILFNLTAPAPPPPSPPPPPPPSPTPPPPAWLSFTLALNGVNELSITRQLITLLNITTKFNALTDTTCFFPSNKAWSLFGNDAVDRGQFITVTNNASLPGHRRLRADDVPVEWCVDAACAVKAVMPHDARRRMIATIQNNTFDPTAFYDTIGWNVTLQDPNNTYTLDLMRNALITSCLNPKNYPGSCAGGVSCNAPFTVVQPLASFGSNIAYEPLLAWPQGSFISIYQTK